MRELSRDATPYHKIVIERKGTVKLLLERMDMDGKDCLSGVLQ